MSQLSKRQCLPCEGKIEKIGAEEAKEMMAQIPGWTLSEDATRITRSYAFKDFAKALEFTNKIGKLAEQEWHHPDIKLSWGSVEVTFMTHSIRGLAVNDFIMAAKVNEL